MVIKLKRGETKRYLISVYERDGETPIDLADFDVLFTIKNTIHDMDPLDINAIIKKTANKLPNLGKAEVILTEQDTFIPAGNYYYDIKIRKGDGTWTKYRKTDTIKVLGQATNRK